MRDGRAPNHVHAPITHTPDFSLTIHTYHGPDGYYKEHERITRLCLDSMIAGAKGHNTELIIWDNGSPPAFREMLRSYKPDVLIESPNVGPHNARRALCHIARGKYINFTDDDILYSPDWLTKMFAVMTTYPNTAVVSGSPINGEFKRDFTPAHKFADQTPGCRKVTGFDLIPKEWEADWCYSIGKKPEGHKASLQETYIEYGGVKAWAQAHHMQMFCNRQIITPFMQPTTDIIQFWDIAKEISAAGHLQLTTYDRTAVHIGNRLDDSIMRICKAWGIDV